MQLWNLTPWDSIEPGTGVTDALRDTFLIRPTVISDPEAALETLDAWKSAMKRIKWVDDVP